MLEPIEYRTLVLNMTNHKLIAVEIHRNAKRRVYRPTNSSVARIMFLTSGTIPQLKFIYRYDRGVNIHSETQKLLVKGIWHEVEL